MLGVYVFVLGVFLGSFLHTMTYRMPKGLGVMARSSCDSCGKQISLLGLVPLAGFLALRGKASCCGVKIPWKYPLIELANGAIAYAIFAKTGLSIHFIYEMLVWEALILLALLDFDTMLIFWQPVIFCLVARGMQIWLLTPEMLANSLFGLFIGAGVTHFIAYFYTILRGTEGLGEGDATLMGVVGFVLGWKALMPLIFLSSLLGIVLILITAAVRRTSIKQAYPFGPAIILASFAIHFFPSTMKILGGIFPIFVF